MNITDKRRGRATLPELLAPAGSPEALRAAVAAGLYPSVLEAEDALCPGACATYTPDKERHEFYLRRYERYKELANFVL